MRYTYLFTQVSRFEDGNLVPVTDKPYENVEIVLSALGETRIICNFEGYKHKSL